MARLNVAKHESVWFDTDIRKALEFDVIGANTFGLWTRLPFLVGDDLNDHAVPELPVIARDSDMPDGEVARLLDELMAAGVIELLSTGAHRMSALSKRYYLFTEPAGSAGLADGEADI